jgi:hypothetical protein
MKKSIFGFLLFTSLQTTLLSAQVEGISGPYIDLDDSKFVQDKLISSYIERAKRENYYGDLDESQGQLRRFGPTKPLTFYVDQYYDQQAREEAQRLLNQQSGKVDELLNSSIQKENEIRDQLISMQNKNDGLVKRLVTCKRTRGRRC